MLAGFIITLREGLEAALIVGIVLGVLRRLGKRSLARYVWAGVFTALVVSIAAGIVLNRLGIEFSGRGEELFEGFTMLLAAGVLTWMIFWMRKQGRKEGNAVESAATAATLGNSAKVLFTLSFVAVVREGLETALFLTAAAYQSTALQTLTGGVLGLFAAVALGWLIYASSKRLNLRAFFNATSILLVLFAAGLLAYGAHELQEAALLPVIIEHVWDINYIINESGILGMLLRALFGYNANPSLLEVIVYVVYLVVVGVILLVHKAQPSNKQQAVTDG
ncbi:MAG: iron uptake transporter permease EfeU [Anaerolineae bacterium]